MERCDIKKIECWMNQKPPQKEGFTVEGFPIGSQKELPETEVFPHIGVMNGILRPIDQSGVKPGMVRVILLNKIAKPQTNLREELLT